MTFPDSQIPDISNSKNGTRELWNCPPTSLTVMSCLIVTIRCVRLHRNRTVIATMVTLVTVR